MNKDQCDLLGGGPGDTGDTRQVATRPRCYKEGVGRKQSDLIGYKLDDFVDENNPVRGIDAYVESLNLQKLGFTNTQATSGSGQPAYSPSTLLKLYLYGYQNGIRSTRRLARECARNVEVMWLLQKLSPEYRTIGDFRMKNTSAIRQVHKEFIELCRQAGLLSESRVSIDGSHFKGNVSAKSFRKKEGLNRRNKAIEKEIDTWIEQVEQIDAQESKEAQSAQKKSALIEMTNAIETLRDEKFKNDQLLEKLDSKGFSHISLTDSDAQRMSKAGKGVQGFNVQIAVEHKNKLIVSDDVNSRANDRQELFGMAQSAKEALGKEKLEVLADQGYYSGAQLQQCYDNDITAYVPIMTTRALIQAEHRYKRSEFTYDKARNVYVCPVGELLHPTGKQRAKGDQKYASRKASCDACKKREQCLTSKGTIRVVVRGAHEELKEQHQERMNKLPDVMSERALTVEHPFGTIKARAGWTHFLVRGLKKVKGEWSLMALSYNFTRALNLLGLDRFIEICRDRQARAG